MPGRRTARQAGVSVVEMLVAVTLLGLLGSMLVVGFAPSETQRLRAAASGLVVFLEETRLRAARSGRPIAVVYDPSDRRYLADGRELVLPRGVDAGPRGGLPDGVVVRPSGESAGASIVLALGVARTEVRLDWLTGRVELRE